MTLNGPGCPCAMALSDGSHREDLGARHWHTVLAQLSGQNAYSLTWQHRWCGPWREPGCAGDACKPGPAAAPEGRSDRPGHPGTAHPGLAAAAGKQGTVNVSS